MKTQTRRTRRTTAAVVVPALLLSAAWSARRVASDDGAATRTGASTVTVDLARTDTADEPLAAPVSLARRPVVSLARAHVPVPPGGLRDLRDRHPGRRPRGVPAGGRRDRQGRPRLPPRLGAARRHRAGGERPRQCARQPARLRRRRPPRDPRRPRWTGATAPHWSATPMAASSTATGASTTPSARCRSCPRPGSPPAVDGDADGQRDPQDVDDASLAAAVQLCFGDDDLATPAGRRAAVHRYNHSDSYVTLVLAIRQRYLDHSGLSSLTSSVLSVRAYAHIDSPLPSSPAATTGPTPAPAGSGTARPCTPRPRPAPRTRVREHWERRPRRKRPRRVRRPRRRRRPPATEPPGDPATPTDPTTDPSTDPDRPDHADRPDDADRPDHADRPDDADGPDRAHAPDSRGSGAAVPGLGPRRRPHADRRSVRPVRRGPARPHHPRPDRGGPLRHRADPEPLTAGGRPRTRGRWPGRSELAGSPAPPYAVGAVRPPSSSGLGRRPFTAVARVRIPLGVRPSGDVLARLGDAAARWVRVPPLRQHRCSEQPGPVAQLVSAPPCHGGGRGFESRRGRQTQTLRITVRGVRALLRRLGRPTDARRSRD